MIRLSNDINILYKGVEREKIIKDIDQILSRYANYFNGDIEIGGTIGYAQIKGLYNLTDLDSSGNMRKYLDEYVEYEKITNPSGKFKKGKGKKQITHKNLVTERLAKKLANTNITTFIKTIKKHVDDVKKYNENYNILKYIGDK